MNKKILASDYDETFYTNDNDIEKNKIAVNDFIKNGNIFIIATGRSFLDFKKVANKYNFYYDYVILDHGAIILDRYDNIINNSFIDNKILNNIKNDLQLDKALKYFCCSLLDSRTDFDHKNLTKINIQYNSNDEAINILKLLKSKYDNFINIYNILDSKIEIVSKNSNKSKAIKFISDKLNIKNNNIYTIGNGYSDIDMIKDFKGYSIKGAVKEVKELAIKEYNNVYELIKELPM